MMHFLFLKGLPCSPDGKESACNTGDPEEDPVETGMAIQYSCLENPTDRGAWQATVCEVAKNQTQLSN